MAYAITHASDGSKDAVIRSDLLSVCHQLNMPTLGTHTEAEIEEAVQANRLVSWEQYSELLEPCDDHPPIEFGWEDADRELDDDDDNGGDDGDEPDDGGTPAAARGEEIAVADEVAIAASANSSEGPGGERTATTPDVLACSKATDALTLEEEREARKELSEQSDGKRLQALSDAAALLKQCGEDGAAQTLQERMARLVKHGKTVSNPARLYLRARGIARRGEDAAARAAAAERDRVLKELDSRLKLAKADVELQETAAGVDKAKAKETVKQLELEKQKEKDRVQQNKEFTEMLRHHYVALVAQRCKDYIGHPKQGQERKNKLLHAIAAYRANKNKYKIAEAPKPWTSNRFGLLMATPPMAFHGVKLCDEDKQYASASLARQLYQARVPCEATTAESVHSRLDKLLEACMPGYGDAFLGQHCALQLLPKHNNTVDEAMFDAVWRYSGIVGVERFPCGVHCWPLAEDDRKRITEACKTHSKPDRSEKMAPEKTSSSGASCSAPALSKGVGSEAIGGSAGSSWTGVKSGTVPAATASGGSCSPGASDPCVLGVGKAMPHEASAKITAAKKKAGVAAEWAAAKKPMFLKKWDEAP